MAVATMCQVRKVQTGMMLDHLMGIEVHEQNHQSF